MLQLTKTLLLDFIVGPCKKN